MLRRSFLILFFEFRFFDLGIIGRVGALRLSAAKQQNAEQEDKEIYS
jgi:hypothetical protein